MKVYVLTRFSIFDPKYKGFNIVKNNNIDDYKNKLFNKKRLDRKFEIFENFTLPCIENQTYAKWEWNIFASKFMPEKYKNMLDNIVSKNSKINVKYIKSFKHFKFEEKKNEEYCTIRLDDDDGLNPLFFENLQKYKSQKNKVVMHTNGIRVKYENNTLLYGNKRNWGQAQTGLCAISNNIYDYGSHNSINNRYSVIKDETPDMWYLMHDKYCDSGRIVKNKHFDI